MEAGGWLGPAAKKFIDEVLAECETSEVARKAAASKIVRAIGIEVVHKQAYIHDGHVDSRAEERGAVYGGSRERRIKKAGESGRQTTVSYQWCSWAHWRFLVCRLFVLEDTYSYLTTFRGYDD